jgi:2-polyprenyl-3-methyl-5-hydroxy-6-metoxy-1,4-benzoquinol methylase
MTSYLHHLDSLYTSKTFQRKIDYFRFNFGRFVNRLDPKKASVLEIGPGKGEFIAWLNSLGIEDIDVFDIDQEVVDFVKTNYKIKNSFVSDHISSIKDKMRMYDMIILVQVLEHIDPNKYFVFVRSIFSMLRKGGVLIIVVPNANNPLGMVERYGDLQHKNSFTEQSLKDLVFGSKITGYDMEIKGYSIPPYSILNIFRIFMQKILHLFLLLIMIVNGGSFYKIMTPNIVLVLKKRV